MSNEVSFKNRDRFIQLGIAIAALRKMRGLSQEKLAEKAGVSRSLISTIEAPNLAHSFSLDVFYDIADALEVDPADLLNASVFPRQDIEIEMSQNASQNETHFSTLYAPTAVSALHIASVVGICTGGRCRFRKRKSRPTPPIRQCGPETMCLDLRRISTALTERWDLPHPP